MAPCRRRRAAAAAGRASRRRLMHSTGHNIVNIGIEDKYRKFLSDIYTTLIEIKWRWNILIFVSGFVLAWVLFACVYYLLCYLHGDLDEQPDGFVPCLENVNSFAGAYLFSIETMTTIGYGSRYQTEACPGMYIAVMLQSIIGAGLQFALASIVVSKTRRAKRRGQSILFSEQVCIYQQDSRLQLAVRVGDMRKSEIAGAHAEGFLVKKSQSKDGTFVPVRSYRVSLTAESGRDEIFFPWPTQILHVVDEDSPLWSLSRDDLLEGEYELIVVIDGVSGTTSRPFQARKSYEASEMLWGRRFAQLELTINSTGNYIMDLANFHATLPACTPLCSAQDITTLRELYQKTSGQADPDDGMSETSPSNYSSQAAISPSSTDGLADVNDAPTPELAKKKKPFHPRRSLSAEEPRNAIDRRRCSLGDMIRAAQGVDRLSDKRHSLGDCLNIYRHRLSVTDTYLGTEIEEENEEDHDSNQAILTVVSQRSAGKRTDVRDIFKRRRSSGTHLFFGTEAEVVSESSLLSEHDQDSPSRRGSSNVRDTLRVPDVLGVRDPRDPQRLRDLAMNARVIARSAQSARDMVNVRKTQPRRLSAGKQNPQSARKLKTTLNGSDKQDLNAERSKTLPKLGLEESSIVQYSDFNLRSQMITSISTPHSPIVSLSPSNSTSTINFLSPIKITSPINSSSLINSSSTINSLSAIASSSPTTFSSPISLSS